ncbi:immunoglobulin-like domain-containing protein [Bacillus sp. REN16]|uniref:immunoglobulin-like domain-containing protein n=1 Tax=Bacillus sp. REN16 TaxID=2887296 RepID=UPI001E3E65D7|nr:immunoglobulin-like domain-containing protein [Bacillus sp. REN16]MCC3357932.1 hypothetical protein [Bacillus sp. REN16]
MKSTHNILISTLFIILSSCNPQNSALTYEEPAPIQELGSSKKGIKITLADTSYSSSPSSIFATIKNTNRYACAYGHFFYIEKKHNGQWFGVIFKESVFYIYTGFSDIGFILNENSSVTQVYWLTHLNLELPQGEYRIVKTLSCPTTNGTEIMISAEFDVQ